MKNQNKKATLLITNTIGLILIRHVTLLSYELKPKYQGSWAKTMVVRYIPKGKRKAVGYAIDQVSIFEGWQGNDSNKLSQSFTAGEFNDNDFDSVKAQFKNLIAENK